MARFHGVTDALTGQYLEIPFTPEEEAAADAAEAAANNPANYPLSMRQLRLGLKQFGGKPASFLRDVIAGMPAGDAKDEAEIWYEESISVHWDHPMTQALMALAGISPEAGAAMWMQAKDLAA